MELLKWLRGKWWILLLALLTVPGLAYYNMKERKARELAESVYSIDERIDSLKLLVSRDGVMVVYQDDTRKPADGIGLIALTLDDNKKDPERLKAQELTDDDFPVVVFFNHTSFDASGLPVMVRRARDGMQVFPKNGGAVRGFRLRAAVPLRSGGWTGYYWDTADRNGKTVISDEEWERIYLGVNVPKLPTPEEMDKMTDEQLRAFGITRMTKDEAKLRTEKKSGVRGRVLRVGGNPAVVPLKVPVHVFKGQPTWETANGQPKYDRIALSSMSDSEGRFAIDLPPGEYTMMIELDGVLWGNALKTKDGKYPSFKIKEDAWTDYEFRKGQ